MGRWYTLDTFWLSRVQSLFIRSILEEVMGKIHMADGQTWCIIVQSGTRRSNNCVPGNLDQMLQYMWMVRCWYVLDAIGSNLSMLSIRGTCHLVLGDRRARPSRGRFIILEYAVDAGRERCIWFPPEGRIYDGNHGTRPKDKKSIAQGRRRSGTVRKERDSSLLSLADVLYFIAILSTHK